MAAPIARTFQILCIILIIFSLFDRTGNLCIGAFTVFLIFTGICALDGLQFRLIELLGSVIFTGALASILIAVNHDIETPPFKVACVIISAIAAFAGVVWASIVRRNAPEKIYSSWLIVACWCYVLSIPGCIYVLFYSAFLLLLVGLPRQTPLGREIILFIGIAMLSVVGHYIQKYSVMLTVPGPLKSEQVGDAQKDGESDAPQ